MRDAMEELYADRFATVALDREAGIVVYRRTAEPYATLDETRASFDAMRAALAGRPLGRLAVMVDAREGPGRNDEAFEELLSQYRVALFGSFRKTAIVVRTAVGALQTARLERSGRLGAAPVFHDEAEARAFLREE